MAHTPQRGPKVVICIYFVESKYKLLFWEGGLEMRLSREWMGLATGAVDGSPPLLRWGDCFLSSRPQQTEMLLYASALATSPICYFVYFPTRSAVEADCTGRGGALLPPLQHLRPPGGAGTTPNTFLLAACVHKRRPSSPKGIPADVNGLTGRLRLRRIV